MFNTQNTKENYLLTYNQVLLILNYFGDSQLLKDIDIDLQEIFKGWGSVSDARAQLEYLGSEAFSKDLWKVAKTLDWKRSSRRSSKIENKGVEIIEGNIIKMGRLKMKLKQAKLFNDKAKEPDNNEAKIKINLEEEKGIDVKDISYVISEKSDDIAPCRIWLSNVMDDQNNPLINPWACKGTQGLLHVECLKSWMGSKRTHKVFSVYSEMYTWKTMQCELCNGLYPFKIWFRDKTVSLLDFQEPEEPFLSFETFLKEGCNKVTQKSVYILRLKQHDRFKVGRSHEVEFHIEDISVSRFHAEIVIHNNKIFVQDYKSKFGTQILVKVAHPIDRTDMLKNMFQVGRTWLMVSYESRKKSLFSCCFGVNNDPKPQKRRSRDNVDLENEYLMNTNLVTKLENDIENLQKDRDSVFYLDDNFYDKLMDLYINKDEDSPNNKKVTEINENQATIDEDRAGESKEQELESSYTSEDNKSIISDEDDESQQSESNNDSLSASLDVPSMEGINSENKASALLSKLNSIKVSKPI